MRANSVVRSAIQIWRIRRQRLPESRGLFLAYRRSSPLNCWSRLLGGSQGFTADCQQDCADSPPLSGACVSPGVVRRSKILAACDRGGSLVGRNLRELTQSASIVYKISLLIGRRFSRAVSVWEEFAPSGVQSPPGVWQSLEIEVQAVVPPCNVPSRTKSNLQFLPCHRPEK